MNTNNTETTTNRPALAFYHANGKGTGCAAKFELHPAHDSTEGSIFLRLANQRLGDGSANPRIYPSFDWDGAITIRLAFADVCEFLRVFRGECESIQDGKGLFHRYAGGAVKVGLRHMVEPLPCYSLEACRLDPDGNEHSACIVLSSAEALGLSLALEDSMGLIAFGIPKVD